LITYDLIVEQFNGVGGSISHIASGNSGSTKKEWQRSKTLASYSNVTSTFLQANGIRLTRAWGGPFNGSGTYVHHRGMGAGNELNFICSN
jgi:hypothetical protein